MTDEPQEGRDALGRFQPGNKIWEAAPTSGRKPIYDSGDVLWADCVEYFQWVHDNPLQEAKLTTFQGTSKIEGVPKMRIMSVGGLCIFLGINVQSWHNWKKLDEDGKPDRPELFEVTKRAETVIEQWQLEGASSEFLNPNIIARLLGLADKRDLSSKDGTLTPPRTIELVAVFPEDHQPKDEE